MTLTVCATGHRWRGLGVKRTFIADQHLQDVAVAFLSQLQPDVAVSGMALGWDTAFARAALRLRIPLVAAVPYGQTTAWREGDANERDHMLRQCVEVVTIGDDGWRFSHACAERNRYIVDRSQLVASMWSGDPATGTGACVRYATDRGVAVVDLWGFQHVR